MSRQTPEEADKEYLHEQLAEIVEQLKQLRIAMDKTTQATNALIAEWHKQHGVVR